MYLENSEPGKVGGERELSTEAILSGQCVTSKLTQAEGLNRSSKGSAELDIQALVEYTEQSVSAGMDPPLLCVEHCNVNSGQTEPYKNCEGLGESFEEYSSTDRLFESDQTLGETECTGLSQLYDKCTQHCECFKACMSSEHCANHSLDSKISLCCEHCPENLLLFQSCKPSDQQSDHSDYEPDELGLNSDSFLESEMPFVVSECTENPTLSLDNLCEDFDLEQYQSTLDSEQHFTQNISDSMESLSCVAEFSEYDESQPEAEYTYNDSDEEDEHNEMEVSDEASSTLSEDIPDYCCESDAATEENCGYTSTADDSEDTVEVHGDGSEDESSQHGNFESCTEEELSSDDCKSFKTCLDDSFPSDHCFDSSEESYKAAQDDSNDEPTQWESFEENDAEKHPSTDNCSEETKNKTSTVDAVIEDYFDLFDRADCSVQVFAQKKHYISCFDGGDIHHHLHLEQQAQKESIKTAHKLEETTCTIKEQEEDEHTEEKPEIQTQETDECIDDSEEEDLSQRDSGSCGSEEESNWTLTLESYSTKDADEDNESETFALYPEYYAESEDDEVYYDDDGWEFDGQVSDDYDEDPEFYLDSSRAGSTFAPCAKEISVEGDVCEDVLYAGENKHSDEEAVSIANTEMSSVLKDNNYNLKSELDGFLACSEMEPYWALIENDHSGDFCPPGVEDYYAYQIKTIQSLDTQPLIRFMLGSSSINKNSDVKADGDTSREPEDTRVCIKEESSVELGITVVKLISDGESLERDNELQEISDITMPLGIIHSIVSKSEATQSTDSEEEQSDDESFEACECEYCIPPAEQVPPKPLLSQSLSDDPAKICVVIDLDETLVHSSFKPLNNADFIIPVEIEGTIHQVHVLKRPHVDEFLKRMGEMFECVLFTASLSKYADPVSDLLDKEGAFQSRLFREACVYHKGNYVKDLSRLGRDLKRVIIIDNSPVSYIFHPDNAVPVVSWFDDMSDTELLDLIPFFERLSKVDDIYDILRKTSS